MSKQNEDLMQLTLQLRNKKEAEKYAKYHGDKLIGVCITVDIVSYLLISAEPHCSQGWFMGRCQIRVLQVKQLARLEENGRWYHQRHWA
jgi:hypothetical protein